MKYFFRLKIHQSALRGTTRQERIAIYKWLKESESAIENKLNNFNPIKGAQEAFFSQPPKPLKYPLRGY